MNTDDDRQALEGNSHKELKAVDETIKEGSIRGTLVFG